MKKIFSFLSLIILFFCGGYCETQQSKHSDPVIYKTSKANITPVDTSLVHVYITFDDGPLKGSEDIDDAVRQEQIKVNVFVVGRHALSDSLKGFYKLYQNDPYIEVGNHSFSHAHNRYKQFYTNTPAI